MRVSAYDWLPERRREWRLESAVNLSTAEESPVSAALGHGYRQKKSLHGPASRSGEGEQPGNMVKYAREPENATKSCKVLLMPSIQG